MKFTDDDSGTAQNSFSDSDLKRFKRDLLSGITEPPDALDELKALIHRLEAAEDCVSRFESLLLELNDGAEITNVGVLEWRKAKGESDVKAKGA